MAELYLASASPRRRELLMQIGVAFTTRVQSVDETPLPGEGPVAYVERLALAKAAAVLATLPAGGDAVVLGADTAVVLDGRILGKPLDRADALATLAALSGREHQVMTAVALASEARSVVHTAPSTARFKVLTERTAEAYWAPCEPCDKAGSYGIQCLAAVFARQ